MQKRERQEEERERQEEERERQMVCVTSGCVVCEEVTGRETAGASPVLTVASVLLAGVATSGAKAVARELLNS